MSHLLQDLDLGTVWDDHLCYLLSSALSAYEMERCTGVSCGNEEFQDAVRRAVPDGQTFKGFPIHFLHRNARRAFATCLRYDLSGELMMHSHWTRFAHQICFCRLSLDTHQINCSTPDDGATAIVFLDFIRCHILNNMDDVERRTWVYMFWRVLQRRQQARCHVCVHQILQSFSRCLTPAARAAPGWRQF